MDCFLLPKRLCDELEGMMPNFWYVGAVSTREKNCLDCLEKDVRVQTPWKNGVPKPPGVQLGHVRQASMEDSHKSRLSDCKNLQSQIFSIFKHS